MDLLAQPAVRVFAFWYLILALKMLMLIFRTSATRMRLSSFASPEDYAAVGASPQGGATLPDERIGLLFVFRVFDRVSYALILNVQEPVKAGDRFTQP